MGFNQPEIYQKLRSQCGRSDPCPLNLLDDAGPDNATRPGSAPEAAPKEAVTETMDQDHQLTRNTKLHPNSGSSFGP